MLEGAAKKCLIPPADVRMWFDHLAKRNRKGGAEKDAETRLRRKATAKEAEATQAAKQTETEATQACEETSCGVCQ